MMATKGQNTERNGEWVWIPEDLGVSSKLPGLGRMGHVGWLMDVADLLEIAEAVRDATVVGTIQHLSCHEELGGPYWATVEMGGETRVTVEEDGDTRLEAIAAALREATARLRDALEAENE